MNLILKKLYGKSEIGFALVWIGLYAAVMNIAMQACGGFDNLAEKTAGQLAVPVVCIIELAALSTTARQKSLACAVSAVMHRSGCGKKPNNASGEKVCESIRRPSPLVF